MSRTHNSKRKRKFDPIALVWELDDTLTETQRKRRYQIKEELEKNGATIQSTVPKSTRSKCPRDTGKLSLLDIHCDDLLLCLQCLQVIGCDECKMTSIRRSGTCTVQCAACGPINTSRLIPFVPLRSSDDTTNNGVSLSNKFDEVLTEPPRKRRRTIKNGLANHGWNLNQTKTPKSKRSKCIHDNGKLNLLDTHCDDLVFCGECEEEIGCEECKGDHGRACAVCGMFRCHKYCVGSDFMLGMGECDLCGEAYCYPCSTFKRKDGELQCAACRPIKKSVRRSREKPGPTTCGKCGQDQGFPCVNGFCQKCYAKGISISDIARLCR